MKTRTSIVMNTLMLLVGLSATSCKEAISTKACSLNYQEDLLEFREKLANGEVSKDDAPRECDIPTTQPNANLDVNIVMRDFTDSQEEKMLDAVERIRIVINSIEFKDRVLNHTYEGEKTFVKNNGLTNAEVYQKIMEAKEELLPEVDYEMDVDVTMYYKYSSTVGYTYPDTTRTWVNSRFFNGYTPGQVAANVTHEWTHKIGFGHSYYNNPARPYTVPYAIGGIIEELIDSM